MLLNVQLGKKFRNIFVLEVKQHFQFLLGQNWIQLLINPRAVYHLRGQLSINQRVVTIQTKANNLDELPFFFKGKAVGHENFGLAERNARKTPFRKVVHLWNILKL